MGKQGKKWRVSSSQKKAQKALSQSFWSLHYNRDQLIKDRETITHLHCAVGKLATPQGMQCSHCNYCRYELLVKYISGVKQ